LVIDFRESLHRRLSLILVAAGITGDTDPFKRKAPFSFKKKTGRARFFQGLLL
jgi:hypothetical protein